jgi:NADH dehydrogenase
VSIANPSEDSPLEYFRGKALLERALRESGLSYAILRPAVLFGPEDVLINNIAWMLRKFPVYGVFGSGAYRIQPIYVDDLAKLAVEQGQACENVVLDAVGPETFTFRELVATLGGILGYFVGDVVVTREEIQGLMAGLLAVDSPPRGTTRLTDWARQNASTLGRRYASELARRTDRRAEYGFREPPPSGGG